MRDIRPPERRERRRTVTEPPAGVDREALADGAAYVAWDPHSADTLPPAAPTDRTPQELLRDALTEGLLGGPWERDFPRYAWYRVGDVVREFRLAGQDPGRYTGYTLHPSEWPEGLT
ncbi:hypothetical protein [Streptomyces fulvorobeus]|uniref:Uncharacterized protein n=1 Tax=Streptomyces fulvorobeus TaxID=284028 RepID=A0A7J0CDM0_9ACTN|nr:hypothetical protein [Streptomyces fulvorobeus]NYE44102.1 hypothetical protein [Streptomyces fulvorobeus]GFN00610.1 hypothetical protein Sfulv_54200 [Streptomyces fulvorobeus]